MAFGFIDAEGCFTVSKKTSSKNKLIHSYQPIFELTQDGRDKLLLEHICQFFNSGNIYQHSNKKAYRYMPGSTRDTGKARFTRLAAEKSLIFRPRLDNLLSCRGAQAHECVSASFR